LIIFTFQERDIPVLIFSAGLADIIEEVSLTKNVLERSYSRYIDFIYSLILGMVLTHLSVRGFLFTVLGPEAETSQIF
jgi:hypothetical protein